MRKNALFCCYVLPIFLLFTTRSAFAFELEFTSFRATLSKPDTSHTLIFEPIIGEQKTAFLLTPVKNERLGFFVDVNGVEIGYAVDVFADEVETKTENFLFSYRKWKHSRITFNFQTLEGLNTEAENLSAIGTQSRFFTNSKSTKIELFGLHNLYTFNDGQSLFEHFFLNQPKHSDRFDWAVSIVGGWSYKNVKLENQDSIVFQASFLNQQISQVNELKSDSISVNLGPLLSLSLPHNFHFFAEYKLGRGYINNKDELSGLKESGNEKAKAFGAGFSWTSKDKKTLVLLRGWNQKGRHIETSFGDLSVVRFF